MAENVQHFGRTVRFGGEDVVVPPLNLRALRKFSEDGTLKVVSSIGAAPSIDQVDALARVVHAALVRNYPSMTVDDVLDRLDLGNMQEVLTALMAVSGLSRQPAAGEAGAGEAQSP